MIIYNTTYSVSDKVYGSFIKWVKEKHVPHMLETGLFNNPVITRVLSEDIQEGSAISIQLRSASVDEVASWKEQYGDLYQMEISSLFSEEVLYFATILELID